MEFNVKRKKKRLLMLLTILIIVTIVFLFMKFFNGKLFYLSTGLNKQTLMKVDNEKTYTFEAEILMSDARSQYEKMFGTGIWKEQISGEPFEEYIKEQIRVKLIRVRCMNSLAKEKGIVLGREESDAVKNASRKFYSSLSDSQKESLSVTEEKLNQMFTEFAIAQKLYKDMTSLMDIEVSSDDARVINIQYIVTDTREQIEKAYGEITNGSSFFTVAKEYNPDGNYEYELKKGEMDSAFETAAYNLSTGEMSGIIEAAGKYYIIRCTSDNDKAKTEVNKTAMLEQKRLEKFNETFEEYEAEKYIEWNDSYWNKLSISQCEVLPLSFEDTFNSISIN